MKKTRILIADGDEKTRSDVTARLETEGYEVTSVSDGEAAISELQREHFDIIVTDIELPKKSGLEVLRFMYAKKIETRAVMFPSRDSASEEVALESWKWGAKGYELKSCGLEPLVAEIKKVLKEALVY